MPKRQVSGERGFGVAGIKRGQRERIADGVAPCPQRRRSVVYVQ